MKKPEKDITLEEYNFLFTIYFMKDMSTKDFYNKLRAKIIEIGKKNPNIPEEIQLMFEKEILPKASVAIPKEVIEDEKRVVLTPKEVEVLVKRGFDVTVEAGAGQACDFSDEDYLKFGAKIGTRDVVWSKDLIVKVKEPNEELKEQS